MKTEERNEKNETAALFITLLTTENDCLRFRGTVLAGQDVIKQMIKLSEAAGNHHNFPRRYVYAYTFDLTFSH